MMVQPLLDSMRDTRYKNMTHLCLRGLPLVNADAATLVNYVSTLHSFHPPLRPFPGLFMLLNHGPLVGSTNSSLLGSAQAVGWRERHLV